VPSDDSMEVCTGTNPNGASDIFTCNGNATLFQIFSPAGTPHSNGLADNDQQGFGTWEDGGCVCQGGDFCCIEGARIPVSFDSGKFDGITTDGFDPANVALALNYFTWLRGACGCNGDTKAVNKGYLEKLHRIHISRTQKRDGRDWNTLDGGASRPWLEKAIGGAWSPKI